MWRAYSSNLPQDLQLEEMFCQGEAYGHPSHSSVHPLRRSATPERILQKQKAFDLQANIIFVDKYSEPQSREQEDDLVEEHEDSKSTVDFLKWQRHQLERDVFGLQNKLQQEVDLHYALENAFRQDAGALSTFPNLPVHAQKLVTDVAMLEVAISNLEEQIASLNLQLGYEQRERQLTEGALMKLPFQGQEVQLREPCCNQSSNETGNRRSPCCISPNALPDVSSPRLCNILSPSKTRLIHHPVGNFTSPVKQGSLHDFYTGDDHSSQSGCLVQNAKVGCRHFWQQPGFFSPEKLKPKHLALPNSSVYGEMASKEAVMDVKNSWHHPNKLSQEMVKCMVSIYRHLSDSTVGLPSSKRIASPTSPYGDITVSSVSSISESSSSTRSPPIVAKSKDFGSEKSFDPYKTAEKIPWSDIGAYSNALEVSEMSVGKEQLDYAAEALRMFRSLVEQLSRVDPSSMKHEEKLAFWINVYNALMMHAYLAYGVPKNDFKFFSLMQKAAYTVGGHSFNAVVIEHLLLKAKAQWYRPQIALLLAHQKLKLREEVSMFAVDHAEPLVAFSLSFGASSSPAVRVYTAENVHEELQCSLQDYARASIGVNTRGKLLIPKLLFDFGLDLVEEGNLLDWICQFLPCQQSSLIRNCMSHRQHKFLNSKHFSVVPFDFHFRYLFLLGQACSMEGR
eukprot:c21172_g2_i1 orf=428-2461(+)